MWLTRLALRNPILILMVSLLTMLIGGLSVSRLGVDLFPNVDLPMLLVATYYEGASPEDIEKSITVPIERAVASTPGVQRIESYSKQGASKIVVAFPYGQNLDAAQFEMSQRLGQVQSNLPPGVKPPAIVKINIANLPTTRIVLEGDGLDEKELYDLAANVVRPQLEALPGVASASVVGGKQRQIDVRVDREKLRARDLGILDVVDAVKHSNLLQPSGTLSVGDQKINIFTNTQVDDVRELEPVVVHGPSSGPTTGSDEPSRSPIRVTDVAKIVDGTVDDTQILRVNGRRGVSISVVKQPGTNTVAIADAVRKAVAEMQNARPNVRLLISYDQSEFIHSSIRSLEREAVQGGVLAVVVVLVFLLSIRATAVVAVSIPLSILATFILLYLVGATLNIFTLGGLALGIGRLVDDSIVELENIHRHFSFSSDRKKAVLDAAAEVAMPILVSTLTTVVVLLPVVFLEGVVRTLLVPLAMTMSFSLGVSFFVSRTVTPLLCLELIRAGHSKSTVVVTVTRVFDAMERRYEAALRWALRRRTWMIVTSLAACIASLGLLRFIGTEFFPHADEGELKLIYKGPIGTRVERSDEAAQQIESVIAREMGQLHEKPLTIADCGLPAGNAGIFSFNSGQHACDIQVMLSPAHTRSVSDIEALERIRAAIGPTVGSGTLMYMPTGIVNVVFNFGAGAPIDVQILGADLVRGSDYAKRLAQALRDARGPAGQALLTDVSISREENAPQFNIVVDRHKAGALGLTEQQVAQAVLASVVGSTPFSPIPWTDPKSGYQYPINVRLADPYRTHAADLQEILLKAPNGAPVRLANVARIERSSRPVEIAHKQRQRVIDITANVGPATDLGTAGSAIRKAIRDLPPPDGLRAQVDGVALKQEEAFSGLGVAAAIALLLVYMVLASQFKSLIDPLVIMFSVPLGVSGVLVALYVTKTTLNVNSGMGVIMMVGIVVSNGVLLVDLANVLMRRDKLELVDATVRAARTRLRPILMTSVATVGALLPMALGLHKGDAANLPLARAVIGGITVSTFFTLFLIPSLYTLAHRFKRPAAAAARSDADSSAGPDTPSDEGTISPLDADTQPA